MSNFFQPSGAAKSDGSSDAFSILVTSMIVVFPFVTLSGNPSFPSLGAPVVRAARDAAGHRIAAWRLQERAESVGDACVDVRAVVVRDEEVLARVAGDRLLLARRRHRGAPARLLRGLVDGVGANVCSMYIFCAGIIMSIF